MIGRRDVFFAAVVVSGALGLGSALLGRPEPTTATGPGSRSPDDLRPIVAAVDAAFRGQWTRQGLTPNPRAPELAVLRRLNLALTGAVPSLEEVRRFESRPAGRRVECWLDDLLRDRRTADYLAERFARAFVGTEDGPFALFRRRRFTTWLADAFQANRPYDAIVRDLIADSGLWTDHPATNFTTVTFDPEMGLPDPERLAARVSRAFLGTRLDCARCHDHPFQPWTQADFRGLAAFFGAVHSDFRGIHDGEDAYRPLDPETNQPVAVAPRVPFLPELRPDSGTPRQQLANWVTSPRNRRFARATVNRVWAILFGLPLVEPIDDLPDSEDLPPALDLLADDFAAHGYDLHRLIRVIAATRPFRLDSAGGSDGADPFDREAAWAAFPLTRLRPEQVAGSVIQSASLATIDADSAWIVRLVSFGEQNDFVQRYGDTGEDEFAAHGGTIPQRLLLMNGDLVREKTGDGLFHAAPLIATLAPDDRRAIEAAYLAVLTRRPTLAEASHFASRLAGPDGPPREGRLTDLCWTLLNTTEFSWNH